MTPDMLYAALAALVEKVCGPYAAVREKPVTAEEWAELDKRWVTMYATNKPRAEQEGIGSLADA